MTSLAENDYSREIDFHLRLLLSRFEDKLLMIANSRLNILKFTPKNIDKNTYVMRICADVIKWFGTFLVAIPENAAAVEEQKRKHHLELISQGYTESVVNEILMVPHAYTYEYTSNDDPIELETYKMIDALDSYLMQFFDYLQIQPPDISAKDITGSPRDLNRLIICKHDTHREKIVADILTM